MDSKSGGSTPRRGRARGVARLVPLLLALLSPLLLPLVAPIIAPLGGALGAQPRAAFAAETILSPVVVTNVNDQSFAITWTTDQVTDGYVRYGVDSVPSAAWTRVDDVRGSNFTGYTHYVSVERDDSG